MMRETHKQGYRPGDYWVTCSRCGWDYLKSELVTEASGKEVCKDCADDDNNVKSIGAKW
jgi:hypothetical protein